MPASYLRKRFFEGGVPNLTYRTTIYSTSIALDSASAGDYGLVTAARAPALAKRAQRDATFCRTLPAGILAGLPTACERKTIDFDAVHNAQIHVAEIHNV
jgi:hypothetical protein